MSEQTKDVNVAEVEAKKEAVETAVKKVKEKKIVERPVFIHGLSEAEAQAVNTVIMHIENTKALPKGQLEGASKELQNVDEELKLYQDIENLLNVYDNTTHTYRDVVKKIKTLSSIRERIEKFIEIPTRELKNIDDTIATIRKHIVEADGEDGIHVTYDKDYFYPMLDLAYVIFDVAPAKDGSVELKVKK